MKKKEEDFTCKKHVLAKGEFCQNISDTEPLGQNGD